MISNNKGIAIFVSLALLFLLSAVAIIVLLTAYSYNNICEGQIKRLKAMTSIEAGINYAYWKLRTDPSYPDTYFSEASADTITPGNNGLNVKIWVTGPVSGRYTIKSKASY